MKKIIFLDMDGVLADFKGSIKNYKDIEYTPEEMLKKGFYRNLKVNKGAKEAVKKLIDNGYDVYIGSKPTSKNPYCPSEKYEWVKEHFPELQKKIVLTHDKGLLLGDYLVDDDKVWEKKFKGEFIWFNPDTPKESWDNIIRLFC